MTVSDQRSGMKDTDGWPLCECCGGRKTAGPQTLQEVMEEHERWQWEQYEREQNQVCGVCAGSGHLQVECCNGASGCSCRGGLVDMGPCLDCGGTGRGPTRPGASLRMLDTAAAAGGGYLGTGSRW